MMAVQGAVGSSGSCLRPFTAPQRLGVFYLPIETRVNAAHFLRESRKPFLDGSEEFFGPTDAHAATPRTVNRGEAMADWMNLAMLLCAAAGSMAFSLLAAYGILRAGFVLMRPQRRPAAMKPQPEAARLS
jgi:hypothetical protein